MQRRTANPLNKQGQLSAHGAAARHAMRHGMRQEATMTTDHDLLTGYEQIGAFIGLSPRQAQHRALTGTLPVFKMGRATCATKSGLRGWLARQMAQAEMPTRKAS